MFPETTSRETSVLEENKTNSHPEGPDINCFVVFLDLHFNSNKKQPERTKTVDSIVKTTQI